MKKTFPSSGQDAGIGRNTLLPRTSKRRITTNLKTINNQKSQKIKLHGTPTTKELKKHPYPWEGRSSSAEEIGLAERETKDTKPLPVNQCGDCNSWRNSQSHKRVPWKVGLEQSKLAALFPLGPVPHILHYNTAKRVAPPWQIPKALPP